MNKSTHILFGIGFTLLLLNPTRTIPLVLALISSVIGASLPDLDLKFKHRMILHNIFAVTVSAFLVYLASTMIPIVNWYTTYITLGFVLGYISHILLDSLTKAGIALFYPITRKRIRILRLRSNSSIANALLSLISLLAIVYWAYRNSLVEFKPLWLQQP